MKPNEVKLNNPSICYTCENARQCRNPDLEKSGHVGCNIRWSTKEFWERLEAEFTLEGFVCLSNKPFEKDHCTSSNIQLITKGTKRCLAYKMG